MIGAIIGDVVGSPYEFSPTKQVKDFVLWQNGEHFTDDTVMTVAVADALSSLLTNVNEVDCKESVIHSMRFWANEYPLCIYGRAFTNWLISPNPQPYRSYGNGAVMRISSVGWLYPTLERTLEVAKWVTEISHNHEEAIRGAQCIAEAIFLLRTGMSKEDLRKRLITDFGYDLSRTCDEIRPTYEFDMSCQGTVPQALAAFFEGHSFEDILRTAVSLGGDCDTLTCVACALAEVCYPIPKDIEREVLKRLPDSIKSVLNKYRRALAHKV